jgi:hypothetical protein
MASSTTSRSAADQARRFIVQAVLHLCTHHMLRLVNHHHPQLALLSGVAPVRAVARLVNLLYVAILARHQRVVFTPMTMQPGFASVPRPAKVRHEGLGRRVGGRTGCHGCPVGLQLLQSVKRALAGKFVARALVMSPDITAVGLHRGSQTRQRFASKRLCTVPKCGS